MNIALPEPLLIPPNVHRVGQLTAEAMKAEFDSAAEAIESLADELLAIKARLDQEQTAILGALEEVRAIASSWREKGQRMSATVEDCASKTQAVRDACKELSAKL